MSDVICGVCGGPVPAESLEPPTVSMQAVPGRPGVVRLVLSRSIRVDPESGAVCWCPSRDRADGGGHV